MILGMLVDGGALLKVVLYSFVFAVGMTIVFSFGIVGLVRFDDRRRAGGGALGGAGWAVLALVCAAIVLVTVVEAIVVMTTK